MNPHIRKIVIIGPESTGKSTLTRQLAAYFGTSYADEFARDYLEGIGKPYEKEDLRIIAEGQIKAEEEALLHAKNNLIFCDTDLYVVKVWSENKYGTCDEAILRRIAIRPYDCYILTHIDMPWSDDPLREHPQPEMREYFFNIYYEIVQQSGIPFVVVRGDEEQRLQAAIHFIQKRYLV